MAGKRSRQDYREMSRSFSEYFLNTLSTSIAASDLLAAHLEQMSPEGKNEDAEKYLAILRHSQFQLLRVAENLKELSIEGNDPSLRREAVDLSELCRRLTEGIQALVPDIQLDFRADPETCVTLCDEERIERLVLNLVSNSLLHTPVGGRVLIRVLSTEETAQIVVSDNGSGIPRERMDTLFSDYLRKEGLQELPRGAGLGLSAAEAIAKAHGGTLVITSGEGRGTKAVCALPRVLPDELRAYREPRYGRMRDLLIGLSDVLDSSKFQPPFL